MRCWTCYAILVLCIVFPPFQLRITGQEPGNAAAQSIDTKALLDRSDQLEKRVHELEAARNMATTEGAAGNELPGNGAASTAAEQKLSTTLTGAVEGKTGLQIRGFGQVSVLGHDVSGAQTAFNTGNPTLLLSSRLSNKVSAIAEVAFDQEGYNSPDFGIAFERALLRYEHNDYLKIQAGRYSTSIGYYSTAFHNADWAQTTMRRPLVATFQDDGGPCRCNERASA